MTKAGGRIQVSAASLWTLAMDTFAKASAVAAAATGEEELQQGTASALCGVFADWVFVDLIGRGQPRRAVADRAGIRPCPACSPVGPIVADGAPWGAITIVRSGPAVRPVRRA